MFGMRHETSHEGRCAGRSRRGRLLRGSRAGVDVTAWAAATRCAPGGCWRRATCSSRPRPDRAAAAPWLRDHQAARGKDLRTGTPEPRHRLSDPDLSGGGGLRHRPDRRHKGPTPSPPEGRAHLEANRDLADTVLDRLATIGERVARWRRMSGRERDDHRAVPPLVEAALSNLRESAMTRLEADADAGVRGWWKSWRAPPPRSSGSNRLRHAELLLQAGRRGRVLEHQPLVRIDVAVAPSAPSARPRGSRTGSA